MGQRRGLALSTPADDGRPRYVLGLEPVTSTVTVGPREALDVTEVRAERPRELTALDLPLVCEVQLQAHGRARPCTVLPDGDGWRIELDAPVTRPAAGQAAVLYAGERVLASATTSG